MNAEEDIIISAEVHIEKICRVCIKEKIPAIPIISSIQLSDFKVPPITFQEILRKLEPEPIQEDSYPNLICLDCVEELKSVYIFILKYQEALKIIRDATNYGIEEEDIKDECQDSIIIEDLGPVEDLEPIEDSELIEDLEPVEAVKPATKSPSKRRPVQVRTRNQKENVKKKKEVTTVKHVCPICTKEFTAFELRQHAHTHRALNKYLNIPEKNKIDADTKFYTKRHLKSTNKSIFLKPPDERLHKCPYCNEEFLVEIYRKHIENHRHQDEFKCDQCKRVFRKINHLNIHRIRHMKEHPFKCEYCGKGFVIKKNYDCHILTHTNEELPHECRFCLKRFSNPEHLNRHQIIHTENVTYSVKYRVCRCHHCLRTFKDKDQMKLHECVPIEQVTNARYPCKTCKKVFKHPSGLYNHNRNIHKLKGAKTLCSVCGSYVANIYNHMIRHTGEKPYQCNQCEKRFAAKPQLRQHLLVHSGLKPYVCSVCAKAFNNLYNLQVHERIHKGDRCHICPICNKGFLEKSYLKKHLKIHSVIQTTFIKD